ncbi:unnamed protein product [Camellia sinensis]
MGHSFCRRMGPLHAWILDSTLLDCSTGAALEKVVKHAATSNLSEQPSFYGTLCGEGGSNHLSYNRCHARAERRAFWLQTMLKICACLFGLCKHSDEKSRRKNGFGDASMSMDLSVQLKDITVRIIHAGGREELYRTEISASKLMEKYPGMCVARPGVFKSPHESLLLAEEKLFPGQKYYIIPSTTVQKLKRKHSEKGKVKESDEGKAMMLDGQIVEDVGDNCSEVSLCSTDFHVSEEKPTGRLLRKHRKEKKPFVPPIQNSKMLKGMVWEPSLNSIQEVSPRILRSRKLLFLFLAGKSQPRDRRPKSQVIGDHFKRRRPDCIGSDMFHPWTADLGARLGIPRFLFYVTETFALPGLPDDNIIFTKRKIPYWFKEKGTGYGQIIDE